MKYLKVILYVCLFTSSNTTFGQIIKKALGKVNNESFSYSYIEPVEKPRGLLVLLPGWGESPESIFKKTQLPHILSDKGFIIIVPELHQILFADDYTISEINEIIKMQSERYHANNLGLVIGGLSAGGAIAIDYAEYLLRIDSGSNLKGVFAIDSPLDLDRVYLSAENKIRYNCKSKLIRKEGDFIKNQLLRTLKGSPQEKPDEYLKYSAYSASAQNGGNAKVLKNIPIRLYSEPDLDFVKKTYCEELRYEDLNANDLEKLSKFLAGIGNTKAEYITTKNKGFHSWNILDAMDCAEWIVEITGEE